MNNRGKAIFQIVNLILAVVAFGVIMGAGVVGGVTPGSYEGTTGTWGQTATGTWVNPVTGTEINFHPSLYESLLKKGGEAVSGAPTPFGAIDWFGGPGAGLGDWLAAGTIWAAVAYMAGQLLGSMLGLEQKQTQALSTAAAAGVFGGYAAKGIGTSISGKGAALFAGKGFIGISAPVLWGIGIAIVVFALTYKDVDTVEVEFNCLPWQPPTGGRDCEKCNDGELPCSEYSCKSLGQSCALLNQGTKAEACVWRNPRDVTPPLITLDESVLTKGYKYVEDTSQQPPGPGFRIVGIEQECVKAFTPIRFGIHTDEPAQCKIDYNSTSNISEMNYYFGGTNLYLYNHTEVFSLPGPANLEEENITIRNGGNWTFFIRCQDKNGNFNRAEYALRFCVDPSPDGTAPIIAGTSMLDGSCIAEGRTSAMVAFYVNEPANCKWSYQDEGYESMDYAMNCSNEIYEMNSLQLYTCEANLSGIGRDTTKFYIRCEDQPRADKNKRNKMQESFEFNLKGSVGLKMKDLEPNRTIYSGTSPAKVELKVNTLFGCDGNALCYYSDEDIAGDYVQFFNTGNASHSQELQLSEGSYEYFIKCVDSAGNVAKDSVKFDVEIDEGAAAVARFYREGDNLKIITVRDSECAYVTDDEQGCDFLFDEGTAMPVANSKEHVAKWEDDKTYYIKCRDEQQPETIDCSIIIEPSLI